MIGDDLKLPDDGGERYPNLKEKKVGNSNPGSVVQSPLYLTGNLPGGQLPPVL
jgi:hypothetical protein